MPVGLKSFLKNNTAWFLNAVGFIGIAFLDIFSVANPLLFWPLVFAIPAGSIIGARRITAINNKLGLAHSNRQAAEKENSSLKEIIQEGNRNFYDVWDDRARQIYQDLGFDDKKRLSIYRFDNELDHFRLLGRFSTKVGLCKRHRASFPNDQGVIGHAWDNGEFYEKALPNPDNDIELYKTANMERHCIPPDVTECLTMKPRSIWAMAYTDQDNIRIGVVVIESLKRDDIDTRAVKSAFEDKHSHEIGLLMPSLRFMEPSLRSAQLLGF